jgi:hypothetical protein
MSEGFGGLVPYYEEFIPRHFPLSGGKPRGRRSAQKIAKAFNLPLIRVGHVVLIDPEVAAHRLRETQLTPSREPRRPGRPRKNTGLGHEDRA